MCINNGSESGFKSLLLRLKETPEIVDFISKIKVSGALFLRHKSVKMSHLIGEISRFRRNCGGNCGGKMGCSVAAGEQISEGF